MVNKDLTELKQELSRLDQELDKLTAAAAQSSSSVGVDAKMQELKQAQKELEGILEYKKAHLAAVQSENAVLEKSVQSQTMAQHQQPDNEIRIQQLLSQLRQETESLEKRKTELNQELHSL